MLGLPINGWDAAEIQQQTALDASTMDTTLWSALQKVKNSLPKSYLNKLHNKIAPHSNT